MVCYACIRVCPTDAIEVHEEVSCVRLGGGLALTIDEEKCNECGQCMEICPMGDITLSAVGCSFCIICKGRPSCILPADCRVSFLNSVGSIARFMRLFWFYRIWWFLKKLLVLIVILPIML